MTKEKAIKKLKVLKTLAENGVGGEKEGAKQLYENIKRKYCISEEDLTQERQEKGFDSRSFFQTATAVTMLQAEQQECDKCPAHYGQKECEECGTYENIKRLCLQIEALSRK